MPLATGRSYLAIPGPSVIPERVLAAMQRPAPNIYMGDLVEMTHALVPDLKAVARTKAHLAMYITNGHGLWEAALTNMVSRGDRVLVCVTGAFGLGWADVARRLGIEVELLDFGRSAPIDPARVEAALRADTGHRIKAVLAVHVDTATSIRSDIPALRRAMDAARHPALLAVDGVASIGCERFEMDAWDVDVAIAASQKGLMTPAGMGFVWFSEKARQSGQNADLRTPYWDWEARANPTYLYEYFDGTPPTHHLYALREAVTMLHEEGLDHVWTRHATLAQTYWAAIAHWGQSGTLRCNVPEPAHRSHAVTALHLSGADGTRLRQWLEREMGITLGVPLGVNSGEAEAAFRIGHMGFFNAHMVMGVIGAMETAFAALGISHTPGGATAAAQFLATQTQNTPACGASGTCCG